MASRFGSKLVLKGSDSYQHITPEPKHLFGFDLRFLFYFKARKRQWMSFVGLEGLENGVRAKRISEVTRENGERRRSPWGCE